LTLGDGKNGPLEMVWLPGGEFLMGSDHKQARPNEGRRTRFDSTGIGSTATTSPMPISPVSFLKHITSPPPNASPDGKT
jgi:hypothetical protein